MRGSLLYLWRHHPLIVSVFALGGAATLFFALRLVAFWIYWADPAHHRAPLEGWMTMGYIGRSWDLPPEEVLDLVAPQTAGGRPQTLAELAAANGESLDALIARVEPALAARADAQAGQPPPP